MEARLDAFLSEEGVGPLQVSAFLKAQQTHAEKVAFQQQLKKRQQPKTCPAKRSNDELETVIEFTRASAAAESKC